MKFSDFCIFLTLVLSFGINAEEECVTEDTCLVFINAGSTSYTSYITQNLIFKTNINYFKDNLNYNIDKVGYSSIWNAPPVDASVLDGALANLIDYSALHFSSILKSLGINSEVLVGKIIYGGLTSEEYEALRLGVTEEEDLDTFFKKMKDFLMLFKQEDTQKFTEFIHSKLGENKKIITVPYSTGTILDNDIYQILSNSSVANNINNYGTVHFANVDIRGVVNPVGSYINADIDLLALLSSLSANYTDIQYDTLFGHLSEWFNHDLIETYWAFDVKGRHISHTSDKMMAMNSFLDIYKMIELVNNVIVDDCNKDGIKGDFAYVTEFGGFLSDEVTPNPNLSISLGARICKGVDITNATGQVSGNYILEGRMKPDPEDENKLVVEKETVIGDKCTVSINAVNSDTFFRVTGADICTHLEPEVLGGSRVGLSFADVTGETSIAGNVNIHGASVHNSFINSNYILTAHTVISDSTVLAKTYGFILNSEITDNSKLYGVIQSIKGKISNSTITGEEYDVGANTLGLRITGNIIGSTVTGVGSIGGETENSTITGEAIVVGSNSIILTTSGKILDNSQVRGVGKISGTLVNATYNGNKVYAYNEGTSALAAEVTGRIENSSMSGNSLLSGTLSGGASLNAIRSEKLSNSGVHGSFTGSIAAGCYVELKGSYSGVICNKQDYKHPIEGCLLPVSLYNGAKGRCICKDWQTPEADGRCVSPSDSGAPWSNMGFDGVDSGYFVNVE